MLSTVVVLDDSHHCHKIRRTSSDTLEGSLAEIPALGSINCEFYPSPSHHLTYASPSAGKKPRDSSYFCQQFCTTCEMKSSKSSTKTLGFSKAAKCPPLAWILCQTRFPLLLTQATGHGAISLGK